MRVTVAVIPSTTITVDSSKEISKSEYVLEYSWVKGCLITFKAGELILRWLWGAVAQWSERLQLKQEALDSIPGSYPGSSWVTNVD